MDSNKIKIFLTDCDGVLTDGGMYYFEDGNEAKKFNTKDGMGFKILKEKGIKIGIITGETTKIVENRAKKLKMDILYQGVKDKKEILEKICVKYNVLLNEIAYVGDDINDLKAIESVDMSFCPNDANETITKKAKFITVAKGGQGVIREIVDRFFR